MLCYDSGCAVLHTIGSAVSSGVGCVGCVVLSSHSLITSIVSLIDSFAKLLDNNTMNNIFNQFMSKREKIKDKKKKKKSDNTSTSKDDELNTETEESNGITLASNGPNNDTPLVDEEGYIIRPQTGLHPGHKNNSDNHFYSSSDSDSDEEKERKIRIKINPLTNGAPISASVDELIASAGTLSLSPIVHNSVCL